MSAAAQPERTGSAEEGGRIGGPSRVLLLPWLDTIAARSLAIRAGHETFNLSFKAGRRADGQLSGTGRIAIEETRVVG